MDAKQWTLSFLEGVGLVGAAAFLFYRSPWALGAGIVFVPLFMRKKRQAFAKKRCECLERQFQSALSIVAGALAAGYSLENAWRMAETDLEKLYGPDADLTREFSGMNRRIRMNEPIEQLISEFAGRSGSEDISNFAEVFQYAKRSGGNMSAIISTVVERMQEKRTILDDIANQIAAKKFEQKMISLMVPGILLFITLTSGEYMSSLYHNALGIAVMTFCLALYLAAVMWAERIMNITV